MNKRFLSALLALCMVFSLLPAAAQAVDPVIDTAAELIAAVTDVAENGVVTLGGNIALDDPLTITGAKSFTIDLNGWTLSCSLGGSVIDYCGTGTLTITDSSSIGGGTITALSHAITSSGSGKILVSGKATITSSDFSAFVIGGGSAALGKDVLEIAGGTVRGGTSTFAIDNRGDGNVIVSGGTVTGFGGIGSHYNVGDVVVSSGTITTSSCAISICGNVTLTGGTVESTGSINEVIYGSYILIPGGTAVIKGGSQVMNKAPDLTGYTNYQWRTSSGGTFTSSATAPYVWNASHTYVEIKPYVAPAPGSGYVPPADTTVYNDPSKPNATIWLSGSGLSDNDLLVTQAITSGSSYNAMLKLADREDIFRVYEISLKSGKSSTGSAMYLTFDLSDKYAGQAFTLVHKKADGNFEYLYATAGTDGKVEFGPIYELSPFMLVKGTLSPSLSYEVNVPNTGNNPGTLAFVLMALAVLCGIGAGAVHRKRNRVV